MKKRFIPIVFEFFCIRHSREGGGPDIQPANFKPDWYKYFIRDFFSGNICLYLGIVLCLLFSPLAETTVHDILHAPTLQKLQIHLKNHRALSFQKTLCKKQLQVNAVPYACFPFSELRKMANFHCLELRIKNVTLPGLKKALFFPLSINCRKHLKNFEKILLYRKKDAVSLKSSIITENKKSGLN